MKNKLINELLDKIELQREDLIAMSDSIFDNPELCFKENFASNSIENYLEEKGFFVERGLGNLETAFRASYKKDNNKKNIGLLCEYDALTMGHACGHQMQGPSIIGAAVAIKESIEDLPFNLIVYGTPGEEGGGGKIKLLDQGYLKELDLAIMMHGGPATQVDVKSMAMSSQKVIFKGVSSHAALKPEAGRSALDALLLSFQAIEFLREHVREDTKMHYTILETPGPVNVVPNRAVGEFSLRSYNSKYLDEVIERFKDIIRGAALMTGTSYNIETLKRLESKIPSYILNELLIKNANLIGAVNIKSERERTGSTDFGNVTYLLPGACIRTHFVPDGTPSHSQVYLDYGKSEEAHRCIIDAAKIIALTVYDLASDINLLDKIKKEFNEYKEKM